MFFADWIRLSRWQHWFQSKLPFITAGALLLAPAHASPPSIIAMMITVALWAAFGYGINDVADHDADDRAGKPNRAVHISAASSIVFFMLTASGALAMCRLWAAGAAAVGFLAAGLALAAAYSIRPVRLKGRGVWGLFAAAAAQWSFPILAVSAAQPAGWLRPAAWSLGVLGLGIGLRWMAVHQLHDAAADRRTGVRTYAASGSDIWPVIIAAFVLELGALTLVLLVNWPLSQHALFALGCWALWRVVLRFPRGSFRTRLQGYAEAPLSEYYFLMAPVALALGRASSSSGFVLIAVLLLLLGAPHIQRMRREWQMSASCSRAGPSDS
jgi:4-hydroxybenzoate polyprenyltransferase